VLCLLAGLSKTIPGVNKGILSIFNPFIDF
jgi:hypothetical protein